MRSPPADLDGPIKRCSAQKKTNKASIARGFPVGALLTQPGTFKGKRVCCVVSGGNVDAETYVPVLSASE